MNQHVAIIRPDPAKLDPGFLRYFLVCPETQARLLSWAGSGGTRNALTKGMIQAFNVLAPGAVPEQHAIAHILGTLDDKIELNRRMNETLEAMARALFRSWFVDFDLVRAKMEGRDTGLRRHLSDLFPDRLVDSEMGEIPEGWCASTLADVALLNPESWNHRNAPDRILYVDLANTKWGYIDDIQKYTWANAPSRARRVLRRGDTIVGTVRPANGSFALVDRGGLTASTGFAVLRPVNATEREIVWCAATSHDAIQRLAHLADGGAYPAVRPRAVLDTAVALPDAQVRLAFSSVTAPLLNRLKANQREARTLAALRDTLLPKLISGEIRVDDAQKLTGARA
ncbi:restriction endonuclease subunit S [Candidatus Palauibacter sp.]|uniref:restriction endonuclease subunit S n=1 Tax=Candidatus Palauibacter sp. TaxID=3101350 RepID=UPI003B025446